jgi:lysozyme
MIGIDVSDYQGDIDWEKAKAAGCEFAFIRAHYQGGKDEHFDRNWAETKRVGIPRGAYGWVLPGKNQTIEANKYVSYLGSDFGELAPACDFEKYNGSPSFAELKLFIERVEILSGKLPYIYTSYGYWTSGAGYANQTWAAKYPLWHAQYTSAAKPTLKPPFTNWVFWQYSSPGNKRAAEFGADGRDIDINRFNGDLFDLYELTGWDEVDLDEPEVPPISSDIEFRLANLEGWAKGIGYKG